MLHTKIINSTARVSHERLYNKYFISEIVSEFQKNQPEKKQNRLSSRLHFLKFTINAKRVYRIGKNIPERLKVLTIPRLDSENNHHDLLDNLKKISYVNGHRVVILQTEKAEKILRIFEIISGGRIAGTDPLDFVDVDPKMPKVLKFSAEEVQKLRDEVREMAHKGTPKEGIPLYRGLRGGDGDAVTFFKEHYAPYIEPGQEVIFAPELHAIDAALLAALRNDCRSPSNPMPLGRVQERTDARIEGRFSDGESLKHSVRKGLIRRQAILEEVEACGISRNS